MNLDRSVKRRIYIEKLSKVCARRLSPMQHLYIRLYYIDNLSMREIARQCNINVSTVSRTIRRGIERLQADAQIIEAIKEFDENE